MAVYGLFFEDPPFLFPEEAKVADVSWKPAAYDAYVRNDFNPSRCRGDVWIMLMYPILVFWDGGYEEPFDKSENAGLAGDGRDENGN